MASFDYRPTACKKRYRMVVVRKNLSVEKGETVLFDDVRYFFYITNEVLAPAEEIVFSANGRCNQENLRITSYNVCYTKLLRVWFSIHLSVHGPTIPIKKGLLAVMDQ